MYMFLRIGYPYHKPAGSSERSTTGVQKKISSGICRKTPSEAPAETETALTSGAMHNTQS
jgi:hypothetical protein